MYLVLLILCIIFKGKPVHGSHFKIIDLSSHQLSFLESQILPILPPSLLLFLKPFFGVEVGFHPSSKKTFIFLEVADVYFILEELSPPFHFEVKPLQMPGSVTVHPHEAIVFTLSYLHHAV